MGNITIVTKIYLNKESERLVYLTGIRIGGTARSRWVSQGASDSSDSNGSMDISDSSDVVTVMTVVTVVRFLTVVMVDHY